MRIPLPLAGEGRVREAAIKLRGDGDLQERSLTPALSRKREREGRNPVLFCRRAAVRPALTPLMGRPYGSRRFGAPAGVGDGGSATVPFMSERDGPDPLKSLGERLDKARRVRKEAAPKSENGDDDARGMLRVALGLGARIGVEMVVALGVGFGVGWSIDRLLGTRPWAMVVFIILGMAAGMLNVARVMSGQGSAIGFRDAKRGRGGKS
jgi:ATP synthase protein I